MAHRRARERGRALRRGDAGDDPHRDPPPIRAVVALVEHFHGQRGEGVDARVAGADQGDVAAFGGEVEGLGDADLLAGHAGDVLRLALDQIGDEVEVALVADHGVGIADRGGGVGRAPRGGAGADADDGERAPRLADAARVDVGDRARNGAGGVFRLGLEYAKRGVRCGGGERRAFRDAPAADRRERMLGLLREAVGVFVQRFGGEEPHRHAEVLARREQRRFVHLRVDRGEAGDRARAQVGFRERRLDQADDFLRVGVAVAADADGEHRRVQDQGVFIAR